MRIINSGEAAFEKAITRLDRRTDLGDRDVEGVVSKIVADVKKRGDKALLSYTNKFDRVKMSPSTLRVTKAEFDKAEKESDPNVIRVIKKAATRIRKFHSHQKEKSWTFTESGATLGQIVRPLASVGAYVPGGKAAYPSSVLMNIIPAKIAGVKRVVMVTPTPDGIMNPHVLVAAKIAGVDEVYKVGGAQAVAALAYGTASIARVDKIVGPGNVFVAEAKRQVFGKVDIDMIAGPSEILIIADKTSNPSHIAADLLSQAEHDENAFPILVTTSAKVAESVKYEVLAQVKTLNRRKIAEACIKSNCHLFVVDNLKEAFALSNKIGPEHLELMINNAESYVKNVTNAGAIFVGPWTPEALGDYIAGPNHVLPTAGSARFYSPLGVYDFVKRTSLLKFSEKGFRKLADDAIIFAEEEKLGAHARSVEIRMKNDE